MFRRNPNTAHAPGIGVRESVGSGLWSTLGLWIVVTFILLCCLAISVQPNIWFSFGLFSYLHITILFIVLLLGRGTMPIALLLIIGGLFDSAQGQLMGSSSAIFVLTYPLFRSFQYTAFPRSILLHSLVFMLFLLMYVGVQSGIQILWRGLLLDTRLIVYEYAATVVMFPIFMAIAQTGIMRLRP